MRGARWGSTILCSVLLAFTFVEKTISISVECSYLEASYWKTFDKPYACVIYKFKAAQNVRETITNVTGTNREGSTLDDVLVLDVRGFCNIVPVGFDKFFPNLLGFSVYNTELFTISSDDLKQFPKLREIWVYSNHLEYLPSNLFEHNPDVQYISFHANKIKFIGSEFFSKLPKLFGANFSGNVCITGEVSDAKALEAKKKEIKKKCSSNSASSENSHKVITLKIDNLLYQISKLEKKLQKLKDGKC